MNPHQKNKVDVSKLSPEEQIMFGRYGRLPRSTDHLAKQLKERKYFDSGDYALSKSGAASSVDTGSVGTQHPLPENIPHLHTPTTHLQNPATTGATTPNGVFFNGHATPGVATGSPVKEGSYLNRQSSVDGVETKENDAGSKAESVVA